MYMQIHAPQEITNMNIPSPMSQCTQRIMPLYPFALLGQVIISSYYSGFKTLA